MRTFAHSLFILCLVLFCLNQLLEWQHLYITPLYQYLDDILCMPLVLTITLATERLYFNNYSFVLPLRYILGAVLLFSICFEVLLPRLSIVYTSDVLDVLSYTLGAVVFHLAINKPLEPAAIHS
ncbi:magnesium citrate secondary transporter [Pontibacter sp. KCTC 32443]|uniref:magnesium citrate secondary transporter n=1 Tax=Pontibacter TaxID=323449 RepID=UPI00164DEE7F|nr:MULTISPECIES: magnesium citrate secondary transporter [Pontibacter]MBC5774553.1 magnesium citrate secondary transporter [Pontibacter sp. KCTC 32443]